MDIIRPVCRALTGKQAFNDDEDETFIQAAPMLKERTFVHDHGTLSACADSVFVSGPLSNGVEALATPPIELTTRLPPDYEPGSKKPVQLTGPHGIIEVVPPDNVKPTEVMRFRLAPPHEFRVEVPPDAKPGMEAKFLRPDGVEIMVPVPPNLRPGDFFEVLPPALMVKVPQGCGGGDAVVFRHTVEHTNSNGQAITQWCRTVVPPGCTSGSYFAARLPRPGAPSGFQAPAPAQQVFLRQPPPAPAQWPQQRPQE
jgi:hypothetical protein